VVNRYNLAPSAELSGGTLQGTSSGDAIAILDPLAAQPPAGRGVLPPGMDTAWTELSPQQLLAGNAAAVVFALGTAVFFGMLGVTVFGIFFTPVFYTVVMRFARRPPV